ncbi:hypothetical protein SpAn4DRAFT_4565 [Sporomusa ovata]|uniref:Uncharacterized protein n=1 Tax=Sporomusa ovata TaxID=2378 RepID=A0A0U1L678_9FIRM|nr:hypothetical protein SpAn4DRAFT_4565 [Sporomusa ovata]
MPDSGPYETDKLSDKLCLTAEVGGQAAGRDRQTSRQLVHRQGISILIKSRQGYR